MGIRTFSDYYGGGGYGDIFSGSGNYGDILSYSGDYSGSLPDLSSSVDSGSWLSLDPQTSASNLDLSIPSLNPDNVSLTSDLGFGTDSGLYPQALPLTQAQSLATGLPIVNWDQALATASGLYAGGIANVQGTASQGLAVRSTNYGAANDPDVYGPNGKIVDHYTAQGIGSFGPLGTGAVALSPSAESLLNAQPGDVIALTDANGNTTYGYFADRTSPTISDNVVDFYNPSGNNWVQPFNAVTATNLGGGQAGLYGAAVARLGSANIARAASLQVVSY